MVDRQMQRDASLFAKQKPTRWRSASTEPTTESSTNQALLRITLRPELFETVGESEEYTHVRPAEACLTWFEVGLH